MTELNPNLFGLAPGWEAKKREQYAATFGDPQKRLVVACLNEGAPVGMGLASVVGHPDFLPPQFGYVDDIWVAPDFRRTGVGSRIVESLMQYFDTMGVDHITLNYVMGNPEAEKF
jgi:ribosomal protein S18 acetylase RimI-like enzyme